MGFIVRSEFDCKCDFCGVVVQTTSKSGLEKLPKNWVKTQAAHDVKMHVLDDSSKHMIGITANLCFCCIEHFLAYCQAQIIQYNGRVG